MNQKLTLSFHLYIVPSEIEENPVMPHSTVENYATLEKYLDSRIIIDSTSYKEESPDEDSPSE